MYHALNTDLGKLMESPYNILTYTSTSYIFFKMLEGSVLD